jgi:hypothetical protein
MRIAFSKAAQKKTNREPLESIQQLQTTYKRRSQEMEARKNIKPSSSIQTNQAAS